MTAKQSFASCSTFLADFMEAQSIRLRHEFISARSLPSGDSVFKRWQGGRVRSNLVR
jgi:hypothetical protein